MGKERQASLVTFESSSIQAAFWTRSLYLSEFTRLILLFRSFSFSSALQEKYVKAIEYHLVWLNLFYFGLNLNHCRCWCHFNSGPISCYECNGNVSLVEVFSFQCFGYTGDKIDTKRDIFLPALPHLGLSDLKRGYSQVPLVPMSFTAVVVPFDHCLFTKVHFISFCIAQHSISFNCIIVGGSWAWFGSRGM